MYDCFQVVEDEYHVAVFGLLNTGLERVPSVKTFVKRQKYSTTGQCTIKLCQCYYYTLSQNETFSNDSF